MKAKQPTREELEDAYYRYCISAQMTQVKYMSYTNFMDWLYDHYDVKLTKKEQANDSKGA